MPVIRTVSTVTAMLIEDYYVEDIPEGLHSLGLFDHATTGIRVAYEVQDEETNVIEEAYIRTREDPPLDKPVIWKA